ncbi:terminase, partial [Escherichia coli]|nr:terminase [Escherichia coli]
MTPSPTKRKKILWDSKKRRNEALDCFVYALAALR